jgi:signal transduction histidine kinase
MDVDALRAIPLFQGTDDESLRTLLAAGTEVAFSAGDELWAAGRSMVDWWVLLEGRIDLVRKSAREETVLSSMDTPGQWIGAVGAWDERAVYFLTGRAVSAGRLLRIPTPALRTVSSARFPLGDHVIEGVVTSLRRVESAVRDKEALIALGRLAAGLAHELNNPAAAATRAVDALGHEYKALLSSLRRLAARSITAEQFLALDALLDEIPPAPALPDPLAVADLEEALSACLSRHGVERYWTLTPELARSGVDVAWCERAAEVLGDALGPGMEWVVSTLAAARSLGEVREAADRISGLVAAVKSYSQMDRASMQLVDVTEGIDSTLVMLAHRTPDGVAVVRDYDGALPRIEVAAAELNQVWTNLVSNALDAMGDSGTLSVRTRSDGGSVVVEIADTGPGMSPEVHRHAFDPFFTTKGVGQGTGLGLDISRRIVERHGGDIGIDTGPGGTVLRVHLPSQGREVSGG